MEFIDDVDKNSKNVKSSIKKHGFKPEHAFHYYQDEQTPSRRNVFVKFDKRMGILAQKSKNSWNTISEVLAPENKRIDLMLQFLDHAFKKNSIKNIEVEFDNDFRSRLLSNPCFKKKFKTRHSRTLYWPVFNMKKWDGSRLKGKKWKKMRNMKNRLYKNHKVEFMLPEDFPKKRA